VTQQECADALNATVERTVPKLQAVGDAQSAEPRAPGKWSPREILGHLIDSAANNHHRFVRAQQTDRFEFPPYAQDDWVALQAYNARPWAELVALWAGYNRHLAHVMARCKPDALDTPCIIEYDEPVTLEWLMNDYLDHLHHHLHQILE
jgi:hypothetical protein